MGRKNSKGRSVVKRGTVKSNKRYVRKYGKRGNKKVMNAIPTSLDGFDFDSRIEAFAYTKLKEAGITDFKYEEESFSLIDSFEYPEDIYENYQKTTDGVKRTLFGKAKSTIRNMSYKPDFTCIDHEKKTGWLLETKGYPTDAFKLRYKIFKQWLVSNNYRISLFLPSNQGQVLECIKVIKEKYYGNDK